MKSDRPPLAPLPVGPGARSQHGVCLPLCFPSAFSTGPSRGLPADRRPAPRGGERRPRKASRPSARPETRPSAAARLLPGCPCKTFMKTGLNSHRRVRIAVPRNAGCRGAASGPPPRTGARPPQLPGRKVELHGWIKGHQLGLCVKICKICPNLPLSTKKGSSPPREVFRSHVLFAILLGSFVYWPLPKKGPHSRFGGPSTKDPAWFCSVLLQGTEPFILSGTQC